MIDPGRATRIPESRLRGRLLRAGDDVVGALGSDRQPDQAVGEAAGAALSLLRRLPDEAQEVERGFG